MKIKDVRVVRGVTIIDLQDRMMEKADSELLRREIEKIIDRGTKSSKYIVLNLEEIVYMSSHCLGEIVNAFTTIRIAGGTLKLLGPTKQVKTMLTMLRLEKVVFEVHETEQEAIDSFGAN